MCPSHGSGEGCEKYRSKEWNDSIGLVEDMRKEGKLNEQDDWEEESSTTASVGLDEGTREGRRG